MRHTLRTIAAAALALAITAGAAAASIHPDRSHYRKVSGQGPARVVFIHNGDTEDSCPRARKTGWRVLPNGGHVAVYTCAIP